MEQIIRRVNYVQHNKTFNYSIIIDDQVDIELNNINKFRTANKLKHNDLSSLAISIFPLLECDSYSFVDWKTNLRILCLITKESFVFKSIDSIDFHYVNHEIQNIQRPH